MTTTNVRIWVGTLNDYSNGILHGEWLDVTTPDEMQDRIDAILAASPTAKETGCPAEEWFVADYECDAGRLRLGEHPDLDDLCRLAEAVDEHRAAFLAWFDNQGGNDVDVDQFQESYRGTWSSLEEYAEQLLEDMGTFDGVPDLLRNYFDTTAFARDLELGGDVWVADNPEGGIFVFDNH